MSVIPGRSAGRSARCVALSLVVCGWLVGATGARAADGPDFYFGEPLGWVSVSGGWLVPRAGGDLFAFVGDQLTLERADFRARTFDMDIGVTLTPQIAVEGGADLSRRSVGSEYRHFIASNGQPIAQTTRLNQAGVSAGLRFTPTGHGRRISRYAFIPNRLTPYVGAGLNALHYDFSQTGQFVDFADLSVFNDFFGASGWAFGPYVRGGTDVRVWRRLSITFDGRYTWLHSDLGRDFTGFDGIDLAGFRGSTGFSVTF